MRTFCTTEDALPDPHRYRLHREPRRAPAVPNLFDVLDPVAKTRPLSSPGQVEFKKIGNNANFAGVTAGLSRQFSSGLYSAATYLWSHSRNDESTGGGEQDYAESVACRVCERASSDQDIRSNFTASAIYELPFGRGRTYLSHAVAS